jgi:hypothetical protein
MLMCTRETTRVLLLPFASLLVAGAVHADVIDVPGDAPTIQFAIGIAQPGDTVLVQPGTWTTPMPYGGKEIEVRSAMGPAVTIVDVTGLETDGAVLSGAAMLEGFTIRGAVGNGIRIGAGSTAIIRGCIVEGTDGTGIFLDTDAAPSIRDCVVVGSSGVGLATLGFAATATATDCILRENLGGGASGHNLTLVNALVEGNGHAGLAFGGGVRSGVTAIDCVIRGNTAVRGGGAASDVLFERCVLSGNTAEWGGGYYNDNSSGGSLFDAAFLGNTARVAGGGAYLNALGDSPFGPFHVVRRCVFAGNAAPSGDGLWSRPANIFSGGLTDVEACTFDGDGLTVGVGSLDVDHVILRGSPAPIVTSGSASVDWSDVEGGLPGTGNIDVDPQWVDASAGVYCLLPGSACIDSGNPGGPNGPDGSPPDMGAHPFAVICDAGEPLQGSHSFPRLAGDGTLQVGTSVDVLLTGALENSVAALVIGFSALSAPLKGGTLVPDPFFLVLGLPVRGDGTLALSGTWPDGVPAGATGWIQFCLADAKGPQGFAASNGLVLVAP